MERSAFGAGICVLFLLCYGIPNRLISLSACRDLTTSMDAGIPFVPEFVYLFYLAYLLVFMPVILVRERSLFIRSAVAFAILFVLSFILFMTVPVLVPRPVYIPDSFAGSLVKNIYSSDRPVCGFPSLHVSASLLAATIISQEYRRIGFLSFALFSLTSAAVLFIKQHVLLDVLGGILIALAVGWLVLANGVRIRRILQAAVLNLRNLTMRSERGLSTRLAESRERTSGGAEYDLYEPAATACSTFIVVHGVTLQGERDPRLVNFCRSLAQCRIRAAAIELPALKRCRFEQGDVDTIIDLASELSGVTGEKIGIIGFSLGAGLSLAAAANPKCSEIIDPLLLFGPYYSFGDIWHEFLENRGDRRPRTEEEWDNHIWIRLVLAYREIDSLNIGMEDREELVKLLECYCFEKSLQRKRRCYERTLLDLDVEGLVRKLEDEGSFERLSPKGKLAGVNGRVLVLHDENDGLIPPTQSRRIMEELSLHRNMGMQRLLITPVLSHVTARSAWRFLDLFRILSIMGEIFQ